MQRLVNLNVNLIIGRNLELVKHWQVNLGHNNGHEENASHYVAVLCPIHVHFRWGTEQRDAWHETETRNTQRDKN